MTKTRQEIFNLAVQGLASQGWRQSRASWGCAYRGTEGRKCAIGWCIPDEAYDAHLEGRRAEHELVLRAADIDADDWIFALRLQAIHDTYDLQNEMKERLCGFAIDWKLELPAELQEEPSA